MMHCGYWGLILSFSFYRLSSDHFTWNSETPVSNFCLCFFSLIGVPDAQLTKAVFKSWVAARTLSLLLLRCARPQATPSAGVREHHAQQVGWQFVFLFFFFEQVKGLLWCVLLELRLETRCCIWRPFVCWLWWSSFLFPSFGFCCPASPALLLLHDHWPLFIFPALFEKKALWLYTFWTHVVFVLLNAICQIIYRGLSSEWSY